MEEMKMNTNNHNKGGIAVLCPFGCGIIVKWEIDSPGGKDYYTDIGAGEKHHCHNKSQHIAVEEPPKLQSPRSSTPEERTEKANQAITRIEFINIIKSLLDFGNERFLKEEGGYRLMPEDQGAEKEK
jgi:hypothetical protein